MTWDSSKYCKLLIRREPNKRDKYLIALKTTADFYGWREAFPEWRLRPVRTEGDRVFSYDPGRRGEMFCEAGRRHRISRSPLKGRHVRGYVNAFKVSNNCGMFDLAEIAEVTRRAFHWLQAPDGSYLSRDTWHNVYLTGVHRREVGA